ncbi:MULTISPECIES: site-specific integrase [Vibrio]|uniref:Integrase n=1 Tax=Vibrio tasmaniensis TaxID=212663 RepID=A0A2N7NCW3_9VIBR|nr:site-specific integrase [Vibrio tasmaniensis]PMO89839.1 hypothetical protein BCT01_00730 [Vibrio tasmaniensis]PMP09988.1 hypothetical protein BCS92_02360 [Vibrio tasmaniensis]TKG32628.1 hypothetical protein FC057_12490 [Vibrio tasmaniensis]TKG41688.1 hypothetical protein FC063_07450 [Vibrio tasmaniensis]TKG52043.1 hypothetical protein FC070_09720 [Vibrio tasmaniensis]
MSKNKVTTLPVKSSSQGIALREDDYDVMSKWKQRQSKLGRFQVNFPDLIELIDPLSENADFIVIRANKFNKDRGGLSKSTTQQLASVLRAWAKFCVDRGIYAFPQPNSNAVELYLMHLIALDKSIATINQHRNQLRYIYDYLEVYNPLRSPDVKAITKSLKLDYVELTGNSYTQNQATPLRAVHLNALFDHFDNLDLKIRARVSLKQRKYLAIASTLYSTCLREDEICRIKLKDLIETFDENGDVAFKVLRTRSKTGVDVKSKFVTGRYAVTLKSYLTRVTPILHSTDFVFSNISEGLVALSPSTPPTGTTIDRNLSSLFQIFTQLNSENLEADISVYNKPNWTGHSGRIGRVVDEYVINKLRIDQIQPIGDWKSTQMVLVYLREVMENEEMEKNIRSAE